ncbi:MAG: type II and III secretion system protein, partial [Acidobacteriota bacterium]|nr:type II and III secretion system protein [Acidobacteriota bacterium]
MVKCIRLLFFAMVVAVACRASESAAYMFEAGEKAMKAGDSLQALLFYSRAAELEPTNSIYARKRAALQAVSALSRPAVPVAAAMDPAIETVEAQLKAEGVVENTELAAAPPPVLLPAPGRHSFDLQGPAQALFEKVANAYGIQVVFDNAYVLASPSVTLHITDATAAEALRTIEAATDSFLIPLGGHLAMVGRDTAQKRTELMPVIAIAAPIPERLSAQEAQEIATAVQQTLEIRRISLDAAKRVVYFRDIVPKGLAARQMFADLSRGRAQIEVDVEFVSVGRNSNLSYGLQLPNSSAIVDFGKSFRNIPAAVTGGFATFGGGSTLIGLGIANAQAFATLSKSSADSLLSSQIVALDGQASSLHVGDRYPIITSSFSGTTSSQNTAGYTPTINFVDLGLILKITPTIHENMEVTLDVDAEFKSLGSASVDGIPIMNSQQYQGKVRLKDGEWAVVAGLVTTNDSETPTGIAGLSSLPLIGGLFTHHVREQDRSDT